MVSSFFAALALLSLAVHVHVHVQVAAAAKDGSISWTVYHSWNQNQDYVRRGSLVWGPPSNSDGDTTTEDNTPNEFQFQLTNDDVSASLTADDIAEMLEYGWYHVKIQGDQDASSNFVFQTVPSCNLRRANFKDQFEITLPRSSLGNQQDPLTSFAYTPLVSPLAPKTCDDYIVNNVNGVNGGDSGDAAETKTFSSRVSVQLDTPAMALKYILPQTKPPPGINFVKEPKAPGAKRSGPQGGNGDAASSSDGENFDGGYEEEAPSSIPSPGSFLMKYWYIIIPMLIMNLLTTQSPEEAPQQGQPQQGQGGNSGTLAPSTGGSSSQQKARRGKTSKKN